MPEEMAINDILATYDYPWLNRTILSNTLKAFGIEPSGKRVGEKGGRPAILYDAYKVTAMMDAITTFRER